MGLHTVGLHKPDVWMLLWLVFDGALLASKFLLCARVFVNTSLKKPWSEGERKKFLLSHTLPGLRYALCGVLKSSLRNCL